MTSQHEMIKAYRDLFRISLHAVRYSKPARYVLRDHLREAFRNAPSSSFNATKINRTLEFLRYAEETRGLEHKVLKHFLHVEFVRSRRAPQNMNPKFFPWWKNAYREWDLTVKRLNESMGIDLR